jgi:hypothetical protein
LAAAADGPAAPPGLDAAALGAAFAAFASTGAVGFATTDAAGDAGVAPPDGVLPCCLAGATATVDADADAAPRADTAVVLPLAVPAARGAVDDAAAAGRAADVAAAGGDGDTPPRCLTTESTAVSMTPAIIDLAYTSTERR